MAKLTLMNNNVYNLIAKLLDSNISKLPTRSIHDDDPLKCLNQFIYLYSTLKCTKNPPASMPLL